MPLTIQHLEGLTVARDEDEFCVFTLPGIHDQAMVDAVERIHALALTRGKRIGREQLQLELCRLLGAAPRE